MHRYGPFLSELFLRLVHLADEVDESVTSLGHSLLGPFVKLELPQRTRATITGIRNFELSQHVQWHVVLGNGLHHQTVIPNRTFRRPVLIAFFLQIIKIKKLYIHLSSTRFIHKERNRSSFNGIIKVAANENRKPLR